MRWIWALMRVPPSISPLQGRWRSYRLVVEKDGRPSSLEIIDRDGHRSLHEASAAALKAFAPYSPLPEHFPEENLVITLSLHYPAFRR